MLRPKTIWKHLNNDDGNLEGYTLIVPSVAVGNVGQLVCDLLISSLGMKKTSSCYSPAMIPISGYDPYSLSSNELTNSCEIYKCPSKKIAVMQIRAPIVRKYSQHFLEDLATTLKQRGVIHIIIVTSSYAHEKRHIESSSYRYLVTDCSEYKEKLEASDWVEHDQSYGEVKIYGGGFAATFFDICKEKEMPCLLMFRYCSEGDNIPDAREMLAEISKVVPLFCDTRDLLEQFIQPVSWKLLFGKPPPNDIY